MSRAERLSSKIDEMPFGKGIIPARLFNEIDELPIGEENSDDMPGPFRTARRAHIRRGLESKE